MRTGAATVDELLANGGWAIDDAQARAAANPLTFQLPQAETLASIRPGMSVAAILLVCDQADPVIDGIDPWGAEATPNLVVGHERLWFWVQAIGGSGSAASVIGVLADDAVATHTRLVAGATVRLPLTDLIDVDRNPPIAMDDAFVSMKAADRPLLDLDDTAAAEDGGRFPTLDPAMTAVVSRFGVRPERPYPAPGVRARL